MYDRLTHVEVFKKYMFGRKLSGSSLKFYGLLAERDLKMLYTILETIQAHQHLQYLDPYLTIPNLLDLWNKVLL